MKLAVVLVHYRTPSLVPTALEALERDAVSCGLEPEWLLVDNGSNSEDRRLFESLPVRYLYTGENLGYAGGVNLGFRETTADALIIMNPDVIVFPGCLAALIAVLASGIAAAGPRFYWDADRTFVLPPTEPRTRTYELLSVLAQRGLWTRHIRRRWRRHAHKHWLAEQPLSSHDLSGALLAIRRDAWQSVGPFDEAYRLYFEETDWLLRLRDAGGEARFVPAAEAIHLFAQSTATEPKAVSWFMESSRRFRRCRYGAAFTALLELLSSSSELPRPSLSQRPRKDPRAVWLEISPQACGYPAAGRRLTGEDSNPLIPADLLRRLPEGSTYLRTLDASGRELNVWSLADS